MPRRAIRRIANDRPRARGFKCSLDRRLPKLIARGYRDAIRAAMDETGFIESPFPQSCADSIAEILDEDA